MSKRISGITIEIDGDARKLNDSLREVEKQAGNAQRTLKDINKLLKLDPGNTDLLVQKQKYLTEAIDATKRKLEEEQRALEQLKNAPQTEETVRQQETLTREIAETEQALEKLTDEYREFGNVSAQKISAAGEEVEKFGDKVTKTGEGLTKNVTVPIAGIAAASTAAWKEVDAGLDVVIQKTGATGDAAKELTGIVKELATEIPTDFEKAGEAVGEVSTRFGVTGEELKALSGQFIKFAELNNTDVSKSVDAVQKSLEAFGLGTEYAGAMLDTFNAVGQETGISVDTLSGLMTTNAAQLKEMGFNASDAARFLGKVEMSGADTSAVMTGLKSALKNASKEGKSMADVLNGFETKMKTSKDETAKLQEAIDIFGTKAGPAIYNAVKEGSLSFDDLNSSMTDCIGSVSKTFEATQDPMDQFTLALNQMKIAGADLIESAGPLIADIAKQLADVFKQLSETWNSMSPEAQELIIKLALIAAAVGPVLVAVGNLISAFGSIMQLAPHVVSGVSSIAGAFSNIGPTVSSALTSITSGLASAGSSIASFMTADMGATMAAGGATAGATAGAAIAGGVVAAVAGAEVGKTVGAAIFPDDAELYEHYNGITGTLEMIKDFGIAIWDFIGMGFDALKEKVSATWEGLKEITGSAWEGLKEKINSVWESIKEKTDSAIQGIKDKFDSVKQKIEEIKTDFSNLKDKIREVMESIKEHVKAAVEFLKGAFDFEWKLPHIKLPHFHLDGHFSLDPPSVPTLSVDWYKKAYDDAMILSNPTIFGAMGGKLLGGGDGNGSETVVGTDKLMSMISDVVGAGAGGDIIVPVYIGTEMIDEMVVKASDRISYRSGGR